MIDLINRIKLHNISRRMRKEQKELGLETKEYIMYFITKYWTEDK